MNQFESGSIGRNFNDDDGFGVTQVILTASVVLTPLAYIKVATSREFTKKQNACTACIDYVPLKCRICTIQH